MASVQTLLDDIFPLWLRVWKWRLKVSGVVILSRPGIERGFVSLA
jgi:hypothetical protein